MHISESMVLPLWAWTKDLVVCIFTKYFLLGQGLLAPFPPHTFFPVLGLELKASYLPDRCSTAWAAPSPPFPFVFQVGLKFFCLAWPSDHNPSACNSPQHMVGSQHCRHTRLSGWNRLSLTFWPGWPQTAIFPISASHIAVIIDVCYLAFIIFKSVFLIVEVFCFLFLRMQFSPGPSAPYC